MTLRTHLTAKLMQASNRNMLQVGHWRSGARAIVKLTTAFTLMLVTASCASPPQGDRLYRELGQLDGITQIIDNFLYYVGDDDRIIDFFAETDIDQFRERFIEQICELSGGPCEYSGDTMA